MDELIKRAVKDFVAKNRRIQLQDRHRGYQPSDLEIYQFVADELKGDEFSKMVDYLRNHPDEEKLIIQSRELMSRTQEAQGLSVPRSVIQKAQSLVSQSSQPAGKCPHCGKGITPFKTSPRRQQILSGVWVCLGVFFMGMSFFAPKFFVQWVAVGLFFLIKWIVDRKTAKTQIMIYKALSHEGVDPQDQSQRLLRKSSPL